MNFATCLTATNSSGLFELNSDGTVLYSRFRQNNRVLETDPELVGRNFFDEVAGFENAKEFRRVFKRFVNNRQFTDNFVFECRFADRVFPVRVMMVRAFENNYMNHSDVVIVDIRNSAY